MQALLRGVGEEAGTDLGHHPLADAAATAAAGHLPGAAGATAVVQAEALPAALLGLSADRLLGQLQHLHSLFNTSAQPSMHVYQDDCTSVMSAILDHRQHHSL